MPALTVTEPTRSSSSSPIRSTIAPATVSASRGSCSGSKQRELVAAEPEGLAVLAQLRSELGQQPVAFRVAEQVVDALEVVDVEQAEREGCSARLGLEQLALEPVVEMAVVAEPGERVGQCEAHRAQRVVGRALVERDRQQRARRAPQRAAASAARARRA